VCVTFKKANGLKKAKLHPNPQNLASLSAKKTQNNLGQWWFSKHVFWNFRPENLGKKKIPQFWTKPYCEPTWLGG